MFLEHRIRILERFLKNHVTLQIGVLKVKIQLCQHILIYIYKKSIIFKVQITFVLYLWSNNKVLIFWSYWASSEQCGQPFPPLLKTTLKTLICIFIWRQIQFVGGVLEESRLLSCCFRHRHTEDSHILFWVQNPESLQYIYKLFLTKPQLIL